MFTGHVINKDPLNNSASSMSQLNPSNHETAFNFIFGLHHLLNNIWTRKMNGMI